MLAPRPLDRRRPGKLFPGAGLHQRGHVRNYPANEATVFRSQNRLLWRTWRRYSSPSRGKARYLRTGFDPNAITTTTTTTFMTSAAASSFPGCERGGYDSHTGSGGGGGGGRRLRDFSSGGDVRRGICRNGRHMHNISGEIPRNGAWNGPGNGSKNDAGFSPRNRCAPFLGRGSDHRDDAH